MATPGGPDFSLVFNNVPLDELYSLDKLPSLTAGHAHGKTADSVYPEKTR